MLSTIFLFDSYVLPSVEPSKQNGLPPSIPQVKPRSIFPSLSNTRPKNLFLLYPFSSFILE